jgi:hypothetical protein
MLSPYLSQKYQSGLTAKSEPGQQQAIFSFDPF